MPDTVLCFQTRTGQKCLAGNSVEAKKASPGAQGPLISLTFQCLHLAPLIPLTFLANDPLDLLIPLRLQMGPIEVRMGEVRILGNEVFELGFLLTCALQ